MSLTLEELKDAASGLPVSEQAELAQFLLRSLEEQDEEGTKAEWLALAEQRMAEVRAGNVVGIPAEDVLKNLAEATTVKQVDFHPDAAEEASAAANRYESSRAGLGADFQAELDAALTRIRDNPLLYAAESGAIRVCPLHRFPYSVFYEDLPDRVWVAAVGHHSRRPGYWARRSSS